MKQYLKVLFALLFFITISLNNAYAQNKDQEPERYTQVSIKSERIAVRPGETIKIATIIDLYPHWHVYWINPGDSGLPVAITWNLPDGYKISDIQWPVPDKISYDILSNYGYYDRAVFLQDLTVPEKLPEGTQELSAHVDMLVCNEICIPETSTVSLTLNDPNNLNENNEAFIQSAENHLSRPLKGTFTFEDKGQILQMTYNFEDRGLFADASSDMVEFFPYDWGIIDHNAKPKVKISDGTITLEHMRGDQSLDEFDSIDGILVLKGEQGKNKGYSLSVKPIEAQSAPAVNQANTPQKTTNSTEESSLNFFSAIFLAFMGGLVLNLMPCVFPVLSIKALSLVKMSDKEQKLAQIHGLSYTTGVILSFIAIGVALILLKQAGAVIGWGFQLQNPMVVGFLAYLLFAIGLNLIGFFEMNLGLGNTGQKLTQNKGISGSFFTGVLATVVATPCTAPFMATALGFAVLQPAIISISIFAALGFGLALPYLLLAYIPQTRKILPRPGAWMNTFKQFLAFPMFASAIWLIWVISQQSGSEGTLLVMLGMLSFSFCVWLSHIKTAGIGRIIKIIAFVLCFTLPFISLSYIHTKADEMAEMEHTYAFGESFSSDKLSGALEGDDPVFVEMTAAWCITCKINHAVALNIASTKNLFHEKKVRYFIGDWTKYNKEITEYLDMFGRNGVPLYIYYGERNNISGQRPEPKILPQVLTPATVQQEIGR